MTTEGEAAAAPSRREPPERIAATAPAHLPSGTVTFLFTDIEGSTRLIQELGDRFTPLLARHREIIAGAAVHEGGTVFGTEGDAIFVAFGKAASAVTAAVRAQRSLASEVWPDGRALRVRMGIHTGDVSVVGDDYVGLPSPSYYEIIKRGYDQWNLPVAALDLAVATVKDSLYDRGIRSFEPDGPKRLRPASRGRPGPPTSSPPRSRGRSDHGRQETGRAHDA